MDQEADLLRKTLSLNLKECRKKLGITQENLAEAANLAWNTINSIEGCRTWVSDKTIVRLARALHVRPYQLLVPRQEPGESPPRRPTVQEILFTFKNNLSDSVKIHYEEALRSALHN